MPKQAVSEHTRTNANGTTHKVRRHARDVKGARKHGVRGIGFAALTPKQASVGALISGAAYWSLAGTMSVIACLGWALTAACAVFMGHSAIKKSQKRRKASGARRSVPMLRARVQWSTAKRRVTKARNAVRGWRDSKQRRTQKWHTRVSTMPLGRRFNPIYRVRRYWRFQAGEYRLYLRNRVNNWLTKKHLQKTQRSTTQ